MSLIVEDGTARRDAESYASVEFATAYHAGLGNGAWASITTDRAEQLLRKATEYMVQVYRSQWAGTRVSNYQALDWPRYGVPIPDGPGGSHERTDYVAWNIIPPQVQKACAELALRANTGDLLPDLAQGKKRVQVGPLRVDYDAASPRQKSYIAIDHLLEPYLSIGGSASLKITRS